MYLIVFYVPESHLDTVTQAMFEKGAGQIGSYDCCAWHTFGTGQFRPLDGSRPFIGRAGEVETVKEARVEMVCREHHIKAVLIALVASHPYESPAYHAVPVQTLENLT